MIMSGDVNGDYWSDMVWLTDLEQKMTWQQEDINTHSEKTQHVCGPFPWGEYHVT